MTIAVRMALNSNTVNKKKNAKMFTTAGKCHIFAILTCQTFPIQSGLLTTLKNKPLENIVGKGESAG